MLEAFRYNNVALLTWTALKICFADVILNAIKGFDFPHMTSIGF
jgi:hypothetical protein